MMRKLLLLVVLVASVSCDCRRERHPRPYAGMLTLPVRALSNRPISPVWPGAETPPLGGMIWNLLSRVRYGVRAKFFLTPLGLLYRRQCDRGAASLSTRSQPDLPIFLCVSRFFTNAIITAIAL